MAIPKSVIFTFAVGREDDVGGLDVAVDDALAVRVVEGLGDLRDQVRDFVPGELGLVGQEGLEVAPFDVLHRDE